MKKIHLDVGHARKRTSPSDRGAVAHGLVEATQATILSAYLDSDLRRLGHQVSLAGSGSYAQRCAEAHALGADVYLQLHWNAGPVVDRGLAIYDSRSVNGRRLAEAIVAAMAGSSPWPWASQAARPDDDDQPRDEDFSEALACIAACYALRPVGILLEPGFLTGPKGRTLIGEDRYLRDLSAQLAFGIDRWARAPAEAAIRVGGLGATL